MKFHWKYIQSDFGSERHLMVWNDKNEPIGSKDPYWNRTYPRTERGRKRRLNAVAKEIIQEWFANCKLQDRKQA